MRRMITLVVLAAVAVAMMGAYSKCDFGGQGRTPQPAEQTPAPNADPHPSSCALKPPTNPKYTREKVSDKTYTFQLKFDTVCPNVPVKYTYFIGGNGKVGQRWDSDKEFKIEQQVSPGTIISLYVYVEDNKETILQCYIQYVPRNKKLPPVPRVHYIDNRDPRSCEIDYVVTDHEEDIGPADPTYDK